VLEGQLKELQFEQTKELKTGGSAHTLALPDVNDQASFETDRSFEIRIKDRERKLINKVKESLKKISEGTYGICESCGEPIAVKRLLARPVTSFCIHCKSEMEEEERREESFQQAQGGMLT
jgi:DnaK suppressor protein